MSDDMDTYREALKSAVTELAADGKFPDLTNWCRAAGIAEGTVRQFLDGTTRSMGLIKFIALANAAGWSLDRLLFYKAARPKAIDILVKAYDAADDDGKRALLRAAESEILRQGE